MADEAWNASPTRWTCGEAAQLRVENVWKTLGNVGKTWGKGGKSMGNPWEIHGKSMGNL